MSSRLTTEQLRKRFLITVPQRSKSPQEPFVSNINSDRLNNMPQEHVEANLNSNSVALSMNRLQRWLDINEGVPTAVTRYFDHGLAAVTVDPTSTDRAASPNRNRLRLCGGEDLSPIELDDMARLFDAQGVERFFVWLSPGPGIEIVREWLAARGAVKVPWTQYPTMVHTGKASLNPVTTLEVRKVTPEDIEAGPFVPVQGAVIDHYMKTIGCPGFHHFAAFEGGQPIATAALVQFEDMGYLAYARTAESFRRRGAQTALLAPGTFEHVDPAHAAIHQRMLAAGIQQLLADLDQKGPAPAGFFCLSAKPLKESDPSPEISDLLERIDALHRRGGDVLLFRERELYSMTACVNRYTKEYVRFVIGLSLLVRIWEYRYTKLDGSFLEALARLLRQNVRIYAYPMSSTDLQQSIPETSTIGWRWTDTNGLVSASQLHPGLPFSHLYDYILTNGLLVPLQLPAFSQQA